MIRLFVFSVLLAASARAQPVRVVTDDLDHFWIAFDAAVDDPEHAEEIVQALYLDAGTPGLAALVARRGYTAADYARAIADYPAFWAAIRPNTPRAAASAPAIREAIVGLRELYPGLRPATVYFTVGALMTNGMSRDSTVFIGSELALADANTPTHELPERLGETLRRYFDTSPVESLPLLAVHEIVHTQQKPFGETLIAASLQEGIAEFVASLVTGIASPVPAVAFVRVNRKRVLDRFRTEMFSPNLDGWLYNDTDNAFGVRDLGYGVGYHVAERRFGRASNKRAAMRELLELDATAPDSVEALVEMSTVFPQTNVVLRRDYEASRPMLASIAEFENGSRTVDPAVSRMTLTFSAPMDTRHRSFETGPDEADVLRIQNVAGWSPDGRTLAVDVALEPGRRYQVVLGSSFRTVAGAALEPTLIDVSTRPE